jgi:hypothetical protein
LAPGVGTKKRGPQATAPDTRDERIAELEHQVEKLIKRSERAEAIAEIQENEWPRRRVDRSRARTRDGDRRASWTSLRRRCTRDCATRDGYLCSERTMYRVLAENAEMRERHDQQRHPEYKKPELMATAPNQAWSGEMRNSSVRRSGRTSSCA